MSNTIKFCGCRACKAGRHCKRNRATTQKTIRSFRRQAKQAVKRGEEPPKAVSIPYTD